MKNIRENFKPTSIIRLIIQYDKISIFSDLSVFREYISDNKFSIKDFQIEFEEKVKDVVFDDEENRMQFESYIEKESEKYFDIYPKLFRNSIFTTLYSYFEGKLKKLQQDLKKYNKKTEFTEVKKYGGISYIDCYKENLERYYGIDFTIIKEDWEQIKLFGYIRNKITHNNSNIKENFKGKEKVKNKETELLGLLKKIESIEINEETGDFLINDEKFIMTFCDYIEHCLLHIYSLIEEKI